MNNEFIKAKPTFASISNEFSINIIVIIQYHTTLGDKNRRFM